MSRLLFFIFIYKENLSFLNTITQGCFGEKMEIAFLITKIAGNIHIFEGCAYIHEIYLKEK